jgi:putative transposase
LRNAKRFSGEVLGLWIEQNEGAKFWLRVMNELKNRGVDAKAAEEALAAFEASEWGQRYPAIGQSWRRAWTEVIATALPMPPAWRARTLFAFPEEVRKIIYSVTQRRMRGIL